ncbi:MAG: hypothetical protein ACM3UW_03545 [Bacillota bacterium]
MERSQRGLATLLTRDGMKPHGSIEVVAAWPRGNGASPVPLLF